MDVHGAGAQRSDPKTGPGSIGSGPQGDARRVLNFVRCVRGGAADLQTAGPALQPAPHTAPADPGAPGRGFVSRLDRDSDGKVSRREFDGPPGHFDVLDRDRDGFLSGDEAPPPPPPGGHPPRR